MKTIIITIATIFISLVGFTETAEARNYRYPVGHSVTYVSGHTSCGCPVYTKRIIKGYDKYNRPNYKYFKLKVKHTCKSHHSGYKYSSPRVIHGSYSRGYGNRSYGRSSSRYYDSRYRR